MGEWISFGKSWRDFNEGYPNKERSVPGIQIELEGGSRYLIGDINDLGGECDDCPAFGRGVIVVRYRVLLTEADLKE